MCSKGMERRACVAEIQYKASDRGIAAHTSVRFARSRKEYELCPNPIEYAPIVRERENVMSVMARDDSDFRKGKYVHPVFPMEAENARIAEAWEGLMRQENPQPGNDSPAIHGIGLLFGTIACCLQ